MSQAGDENRWRTAALMLGAALLVLVGVIAALFASGWRLQWQDRSASASAETWSPPLGPREGLPSRLRRLAHDVSSLSLAPTNQPDPRKVLREANDLVRRGQYEEALQRHIWYHNHALEYDPMQAGVRTSSALSSWVELGRKYPKARQALVETRDRGVRRFAEGGGDGALFEEVAAINRQLEAQDDTVSLFKGILKRSRALARHCYFFAEGLLVEKGEYQICLACLDLIGGAEAYFGLIRQGWETTKASPPMPTLPPLPATARLPRQVRETTNGVAPTPPLAPAPIPPLPPPPAFAGPRRFMADLNVQRRKLSDDMFVGQTRNLIEILVATGHQEEAEKIHTNAMSLIDDRRLASAVTDAEKKIAGAAKVAGRSRETEGR